MDLKQKRKNDNVQIKMNFNQYKNNTTKRKKFTKGITSHRLDSKKYKNKKVINIQELIKRDQKIQKLDKIISQMKYQDQKNKITSQLGIIYLLDFISPFIRQLMAKPQEVNLWKSVQSIFQNKNQQQISLSQKIQISQKYQSRRQLLEETPKNEEVLFHSMQIVKKQIQQRKLNNLTNISLKNINDNNKIQKFIKSPKQNCSQVSINYQTQCNGLEDLILQLQEEHQIQCIIQQQIQQNQIQKIKSYLYQQIKQNGIINDNENQNNISINKFSIQKLIDYQERQQVQQIFFRIKSAQNIKFIEKKQKINFHNSYHIQCQYQQNQISKYSIQQFCLQQNQEIIQNQKQNKKDKQLIKKQKKIFGFRKSQVFEKKKIQQVKNIRRYKSHLQFDRKINKYNVKPFKTQKIRNFQLGRSLGAGKFGQVIIARYKFNSTIYAIKKIIKSYIKQYEMLDQIIIQIGIHMNMNHQNILKMYTFFDDQYHLFLILQFSQQGSLYDKLKKKKFNQKQISFYLKQIAQGLKYLHSKNIVHRDIKPQNLLLVEVYIFKQNKVKICDFGWAAYCNQKCNTRCGTLDYAAPQILNHLQYDFSVDLWSLGILTYQLLVGKPPFHHYNAIITQNKIKNVEYFYQGQYQIPLYLSDDCKDFISKLLLKQPKERMTIQQVLQHNFLKVYQI